MDTALDLNLTLRLKWFIPYSHGRKILRPTCLIKFRTTFYKDVYEISELSFFLCFFVFFCGYFSAYYGDVSKKIFSSV